MNIEPAPKENEFAIAVHEAGHLLVGLVLGREIGKVSLDLIEGKRGCFWKSTPGEKWDDFTEVAGLLSGPRAQVEFCPDSIPEERLIPFGERIIHPMTELGRIPGIYGYMGWQHDIIPVYERLCVPDGHAGGMPWNFTHAKVIELVEKHLLIFFGQGIVRSAALKIADYLQSQRLLDGVDAVAAVAETGVLEEAVQEKWLEWC